jgi:hypothetical protein
VVAGSRSNIDLVTCYDAIAQAALAAYGVVVDDGVGPQSEGLPSGKECSWLSG